MALPPATAHSRAPGGEVLSADTRGYRPGATVTLEATPAPGWGFKEWTGDLTSTDNPAEIVMDGDQSVTAVFYQVTLTVTGTGEGKVAANPYGGDPQTPTFTEDYEPDGQVTLTAHPAPGWGFKRWTGDASGTSATVTITMDGDKTVNAEFYQTTLTVSKTGEGQVTATPYGATQTPTFTEDYEPGQQVTLTAVPAQGWAFKEWMGGASGLSVSISVTMDGDKSVTAVFEQIQLTVNKQGQGTVSPPGGGETLPHTITYASAQNVNLTASPSPGWGFKQWTGDAGGTSPSTSVYVDGEKGVTAVFKEQHTLTTAQQGQGTVDPETGTTHIYLHGDTASVSAAAAQGWEFDHWEGDVPAEDVESNPVGLAMTVDRSITAVFVVEQVTLTTAVEAEGCEGCAVDPETAEYNLDDWATVTATAPNGWDFDHWEGDVPSADVGSNPLELEMDADKDITAVFKVELVVDAPEGVTVSAPILLPTSWYLPGDLVELLATHDDPEHFEVAFWEVTTASPAAQGLSQKALTGAGSGATTIYTGNHASFTIYDPARAVPIVRPIGTFYLLVESEWENGQSVGHVSVDSNAPPVEGPTDMGQGRMLYLFNAYVDLVSDPPVPVEVTLEGVPDNTGWAFDEWEGEIVPNAPDTNPITLTMDKDRYIAATFTDTVYLTVQTEGEGSVSRDPNESSFAVGAEVDLVANPSDGWIFDHWEGDLEGEQDSKTLTMNKDKDVIAVFIPLHIVTSEVRYEGTVTPPDALYEDGEQQSFTHLESLAGYPPFHHWEGLPEDQFPDGPVGPGSSSQNPVSITIRDSYHLIAVEGPDAYTLTVTTQGQGTTDPEEETYPAGTTVSIIPTPADCTWFFDHWEGDLSGSDIPGDIEMNDDKEVLAVFTQDPQIQVKQGDRFIRESSSDGDGDGLPDDLATIGPTPSMPELTAQLKNVSSSCSVRWKIAVEYNRTNVPSGENKIFQTYYYPRNLAGEPIFSAAMNASQKWEIVFDKGFLGGNATITYELDGDEHEFEFEIGGLNPSDVTAKSFIVANSGVHWYAYAIAKHESKSWSSVLNATTIYNQFNPNGSQYGHDYEPMKDESKEAADGFGMMMVDPPDNRSQLWHWKLNVLEGMERLDQKRWGENGANAWLLRQIAQQQAEAPAKELRFEVFTYSGVDFQEGTSRTPLDACTIQAFNGAPQWTISWNNGAGEWEQKASGYVDEICNELEE